MQAIYLDYNASTPIDPEVAQAMRPLLEQDYGNPSSGHWAGIPAREAIERARSQVAGLLGCDRSEVVFTSGGSESNNLALKGVFFSRSDLGAHFVSTSVEHPSVLNPLQFLEGLGARVSLVPVDRSGRVNPAEIERAITPQTILVSVMHANNEVGTIQPLREIAEIAHRHGALLHTDAAQTVGKVRTDVNELGIDLLTVAGHKVYAPKGVGALYIRKGVKLEPLVHGAGHEDGRRAGTESALLAVGLGKACEIARLSIGSSEPGEPNGVRGLRDRFEQVLQAKFEGRVVVNGDPEHRLPNTCHVSFLGRSGSEVLAALPGVAASTGSACHTGSTFLSPVLQAMGVSEERGRGAVRFSLGRWTTEEEIDEVIRRLEGILL